MAKRSRIKVLQYYAVFQEETDGGFSAWVPALPGCTSQGETFEETINNIKEAIGLYVESEPEIIKLGDESKEKQFLVPIKIAHA